MFAENKFSVVDFVYSISEIIDLISPGLNNHHKRAGYISYSIAKEMALPDEEVKDIFLAATLHDIGAFTNEERVQIHLALFDDSSYNHHAIRGYKLLQKFDPLINVATLIKYHHEHFDEAKTEVPIGSYIIHLADRLAILFDENSEILGQIPKIIEQIDQRQTMFHPEAVAALRRLVKLEYFWIDASLLSTHHNLLEGMRLSRETMDLKTLRSFAKTISNIIDFRSRFTAAHSSGVAAVALELTIISGFSERESRLMEIAGFLHDLGKLAVPNHILEKNDALTAEEYNEIRKHTYFTYLVLSKIKGFEAIAKWAAYHHERLNGKGYPFHIKGSDLSKLERIMVVADIVAAITEDRPYCLGVAKEKAIKILTNLVENGGIDKGIVEIVIENFARIQEARGKAQTEALEEYNTFRSTLDEWPIQ